ncbi:MAG: ATPase [Pedobacter sp.]|nr:MAG: ATPase [Pedobacter sp.]
MAEAIIITTPDCEIVSSRIVNAPIETVYEAFANPAHLKNWWGPAGFTNTFNEFDFKVGGKWSFIMHGPEAGHYANECEFIKIEKPTLIAWKRHSQPFFQVLFIFESLAENETKIVFKMLFETAKECSKLKPYVVDKNEENFDRLEVELLSI